MAPTCDETSLQTIQDDYVAFLAERFPETPPVPLAQRLAGDTATGVFSEHLSAFISRIVKTQGAAPRPEHLDPRRASRPSSAGEARRGVRFFAG